MRGATCFVTLFVVFTSLCAGAQSYPKPSPAKRVFTVSDVTKASISWPIKARDSSDLYTLVCHSAGYHGDSGFEYSGDFECRLILVNGQNTYSTLLTEDVDQSRDWESRGRFFGASLRGECSKVPEFGAMRNFTLRGMRLTLQVLDPKFQGEKLLSLKLAVAVVPDAKARRAIADIVPLPRAEVPVSCKLSEYFADSTEVVAPAQEAVLDPTESTFKVLWQGDNRAASSPALAFDEKRIPRHRSNSARREHSGGL